MGAVDSAALDHYLPSSYKGDDENILNKGLAVGTANGGTMYSVASNVLKLCQLPMGARRCHKFAEVHLPLISVGKICQHGFTVTFTHDSVVVTHDRDAEVVLRGIRDPVRNLYMIPLDGTHGTLPRVANGSPSPMKVRPIVPRVCPPPLPVQSERRRRTKALSTRTPRPPVLGDILSRNMALCFPKKIVAPSTPSVPKRLGPLVPRVETSVRHNLAPESPPLPKVLGPIGSKVKNTSTQIGVATYPPLLKAPAPIGTKVQNISNKTWATICPLYRPPLGRPFQEGRLPAPLLPCCSSAPNTHRPGTPTPTHRVQCL